MRKNKFDVATDILKERMRHAMSLMKEEGRHTNPYRMERVPQKERVRLYENLDEDGLNNLIMTLGEDQTNDFLREMMTREERYGRTT